MNAPPPTDSRTTDDSTPSAESRLRIRPAEAADAPRWNAYLETQADATFFHRAEWRSVIERAFGHPTHYLIAERDAEICGVLPLARVKSLLFGHALISTPFCVYGGIVASDDAARRELADAATGLAERHRVDYLELRHRRRQLPNWACRELHVTFRREIAADDEANLAAIPRKQRAMVRKGIKSGLASTLDADTERFFEIYSESVRNLGTPVFHRGLFRELKLAFGDACEVLTVLDGTQPVASVLSFYHRDEILPYYGGGTRAARDVAANDFMYWEVMRRAAERGVRIFDFGRSKREAGSYHFKRHWGFEPEPLYYECRLVRARELPEINPVNPRYERLARWWRRLPLPVSRIVGPWIARSLG